MNKYIQTIKSFNSGPYQNYQGNNIQGQENKNIEDYTFPSDSI